MPGCGGHGAPLLPHGGKRGKRDPPPTPPTVGAPFSTGPIGEATLGDAKTPDAEATKDARYEAAIN
jgi:hypothetical protein